MKVQYLLGKTVIGPCCIATTSKGICFLEFGKTRNELLTRLKETNKSAELVPATKTVATELKRVLSQIGTAARTSSVRLDVRGTEFQQRVWTALRKIPPGRTVAYSDIAKTLGRPSAFRAVAKACATNCIGVLIPCHRVVSKSGKLSGYRWGVEKKRKLLAAEQAV